MSKIRDIQAQTGFSKTAKRAPEDYYITPDIATIELLKREKFDGAGWEPACGNGAISKFFPEIASSDIRFDNIAGEPGIDFLTTNKMVDFIVTNPPFKLILPFIQHSLECANKVAIFARIQLLEGKERYNFFKQNPPIRIYVFSNRVNCSTGNITGTGIMCFCWFIWEKGFTGQPVLDWILHK